MMTSTRSCDLQIKWATTHAKAKILHEEYGKRNGTGSGKWSACYTAGQTGEMSTRGNNWVTPCTSALKTISEGSWGRPMKVTHESDTKQILTPVTKPNEAWNTTVGHGGAMNTRMEMKRRGGRWRRYSLWDDVEPWGLRGVGGGDHLELVIGVVRRLA